MQKVLNIYKPIGLTPLQLIKELQLKHPKYAALKIGYAGRLDPMAHGVMILLVHPETTNRSHYQNLDKSYSFECVLGIKTDTSDALGKLKFVKSMKTSTTLMRRLEKEINELVGTTIQTYPVYSSKTVQGKPLFWWARNNKLSQIEIPKKSIKIFSAKLVGTREISTMELHKKCVHNITKIIGDFRQDEIVNLWGTFLLEHKNDSFVVAKINIECQSGTYVRSLCERIGTNLGCGGVAIDILRSKVGEFSLDSSMRL